MTNLKCFCLLFVICSVVLFLAGCDHCGGERTPKVTYSLINKTNKSLYYKAHLNSELFDTALRPDETLFLYSREWAAPNYFFEDSTFFLSNDSIIIKDDSEIVLFYRSKGQLECGGTNFVKGKVEGKKDNRTNYYYWTIDSAYIADNSCNMSWDDFEREYLNNE